MVLVWCSLRNSGFSLDLGGWFRFVVLVIAVLCWGLWLAACLLLGWLCCLFVVVVWLVC